MRTLILLLSSFFLSMGLVAQSHLNFAYTIEGGVFKDDSLTYFVAHEYPVFHNHPDDNAAKKLSEHFQKGTELSTYLANDQLERVTVLPSISDDALLDPAALLELLANRIGMSSADLKNTPHKVEISIHSLKFPDQRQPYFNHQTWQAQRTSEMKRFQDEKHTMAMDWNTGEALLLGTLGGRSATACLIKALEVNGLAKFDCNGKPLHKVIDEVSCSINVMELTRTAAIIHWGQLTSECEGLEAEAPLSIPLECLTGEGSCGD